MFGQPLFLLLLLALPILLLYRRNRYFLRHAYVGSFSGASRDWMRLFKELCLLTAISSLVIAAAEPRVKTIEIKKSLKVHKYVLINDGSGSMVEPTKPKGVGLALGTVAKGNAKFLELLDKRSDGSRDLIGAIVFSTNAYVVCHMVDDPKFVLAKLDAVDYKVTPMGQGTQLEEALWEGLCMATRQGSPSLELSDDMRQLARRMFGFGKRLATDEVITRMARECKDKAGGASLIVFTDGVFSNPEGGAKTMSCYKLMDFCRMSGIRIYVISVEELGSSILAYCRRTGGNGVVIKTYDQRKFEQAYADIIDSQANEYEITEKVADKSVVDLIAYIGLSSLCVWMAAAYLFGRVFTDI